jgi:hypothetical protein
MLEYKNKIIALASKYKNVELFFDEKYDNIMKAVNNAKVLLLHSNESFSYVLLEAAYYGTFGLHISNGPSASSEIFDELVFSATPDTALEQLKKLLNKVKPNEDIIMKFRNKFSRQVFRENLIKLIEKESNECKSYSIGVDF